MPSTTAVMPSTTAAMPRTTAAMPRTAAAMPPTAAAVPPTAAAVPPTAAAVPATPNLRSEHRGYRAADITAVLLGSGSIAKELPSIPTALNLYEQEGWELSGVTSGFVIFKRALAGSVGWEYRAADITAVLLGSGSTAKELPSIPTALNPYGQEGWELSGVTSGFVIFK